MITYLHYILTYMPTIGTLIGGYYLSNMLLKEGQPVKKSIYLIFIFCAICSIYSFSITKFQYLKPEFSHPYLEWMEEKITFVYLSVSTLSLLGFLSFIGLFFFQGNYSKEISLAIVISILALISSIFSIRSEYIHPSWKFYQSFQYEKIQQEQ